MAKWKAPADAGAGVSVGGEFFPIIDGHVSTPSGDYAAALIPFGYEQVDDSGETPPAAPEAAAPVAEVAPAAPVAPAEPETPPSAAPESAPADPAPAEAPAAPVEG